MTLCWSWDEYWVWFIQLETDKQRGEALRELNVDNWISRLNAETQAKVFKDAPMEIKINMKKYPKMFKTETIQILEAQLNKHKSKRRAWIK